MNASCQNKQSNRTLIGSEKWAQKNKKHLELPLIAIGAAKENRTEILEIDFNLVFISYRHKTFILHTILVLELDYKYTMKFGGVFFNLISNVFHFLFTNMYWLRLVVLIVHRSLNSLWSAYFSMKLKKAPFLLQPNSFRKRLDNICANSFEVWQKCGCEHLTIKNAQSSCL